MSLADTFRFRATVWPWIYAVSGALVTIGAVLTIITAGTWPARSDRFQPGSSKAEVAASEDPAELWKALDAGVDPTGNTDASLDTAKVPYPDVHDRAAGDTMDDTEGPRGQQEREA